MCSDFSLNIQTHLFDIFSPFWGMMFRRFRCVQTFLYNLQTFDVIIMWEGFCPLLPCTILLLLKQLDNLVSEK